MKERFKCVVDGCDFTAEGETEEEALEELEKHSRDRHPDLDVSQDQLH